MNKLTSKNPVQRFKQGKQIQKMSGGGPWSPENRNKTYTPRTTKKLNNFNSEIRVIKDENDKLEKQVNQTINRLKFKEYEKSNINKSNKDLSIVNKKSNSSNSVSPHFMKGYENIQPEIGGAENIKAMQQKMQSFYAPGTYKDDGIWGKNTQAAYEKYLQSLTPKQETKPQSWFTPLMAQTIPSTTNFGYRTNNTYEGNDFYNRLKGLGIGSNADLINWMHSTGANNYDWKGNNWAKQFRSDVNQALGGDYSDANIRNTFNTAGNWGRGFLGGGDISDFQKALQTNAGVWNGRYDQKKESQPLQNFMDNYFATNGTNFNWKSNLAASRNWNFNRGNLFRAKQGGTLLQPRKSLIQQFKSRISNGFNKF